MTTRSQRKLESDVDALIKAKKDKARAADRARVEAVDDEATVTKPKKGPKTQDLPRAKGGVAEVAPGPKVTPKKKK